MTCYKSLWHLDSSPLPFSPWKSHLYFLASYWPFSSLLTQSHNIYLHTMYKDPTTVCVYMCTFVCVFNCACTHGWMVAKGSLGYNYSGAGHHFLLFLFFSRQGLSLLRNSPSRASWLAVSPCWIHLSLASRAGITSMYYHSWVFTWILKIKFRSSISPVPNIFISRKNTL